MGYSYDAAGNMTSDGNHTYTYDAENRIISMDGGAATYLYDALGRRTSKRIGTAFTDYAYDLAGNPVIELKNSCGGQTCWATGYVYLGGQLVAEYKDATTYFIHRDHLGSTRLMTRVDRTIQDSMDYQPYGEQLAGDTGSTHKFTGKERDGESGLDYLGARYYGSAMGRFASADNFMNDTSAVSPASWNLYAYARNNPMRYTDPSGEKIYVGDLSPADRLELLKRLGYTYGCAGCITVDPEGYLEVDTSNLDQGVKKATQYLTDAINSETYFAEVEVSNNDPDVAFGENRPTGKLWYGGRWVHADKIVLDFSDDQWVSAEKGAEDARTAFLYTVFAHEIAHGFFGADPDEGKETGPVVDAVNRVTDALGVPRRAEYVGERRGDHWASVRFEKREVNKNGRSKQKDVYIDWVKRNVGGKGIN